MDKTSLIDSFSEFKDDKNIDRVTLMSILEEVFRSMLIKKYGSSDNFDIIVNPQKGDLEIWRNRIVVEDGAVEDPNTEIPYSEAIRIEPDFEIDEEVSEEVKIESFGRRGIMAMRQNLISRIQEHDNSNLFKQYKDMVGEIITGEVHHIRRREIIIYDDDHNELILPKEEQIRSDYFRKGETVRAIVKEVKIAGTKPRIILSRTSSVFLEKLFELEIPEILDGLITIKAVQRIPGEKAKIAVESYDERIDPVGACVGMKGSRIHGIVRELGNENIDVINYSINKELFIKRALSPAKITSMNINMEDQKVDIYLKPDQVSLAIGKSGSNIKLAAAITGFEIDVYRDIEDEDVLLSEFSDEIDGWIIDQFKEIGCDTAKSVLELSVEFLVNRTDLEEETIIEVQNILRSEFE
ncbi:MAG: transcription termination factor NusA [Flavobacteriales bacterium]|jgi:N utilization substance protein A|nr:transcription termination factor NusA [Flavobacteriales bacterium]